MLHQPTPPEPAQRVDRDLRLFCALLDILHRMAGIYCTLAAHKEDVESSNSPVGDLFSQHAKAFREAVSCVQRKLLDANLVPGDLVPIGLVEQADTLWEHLSKVSALQIFYDRHQAAGQDGGLNALFAAKFILQADEYGSSGPSSTTSDDLQRGEDLQRGIKALRKFIQAIKAPESGSIPTDEADRLVEKHEKKFNTIFPHKKTMPDPRYVHIYPNMEDVPYNHDFSSGISKGSFALVRKVKHRGTSEVLAMKTFFKESDRAQILREIGILEVCDHPNILKLVEAFTVATEDDEGTIHIVMEPWAPFTLQKFLESSDEMRRAQCPWFQPGSLQSDLCIYHIMQQLAEAVEYLHRLSIKHKDIKPDNILLHEPGSTPPRAIVADVGVSKVMVRGGSTKYDDCSYTYLAPEQVKKRESSLRADVWQLGCCFALLLAVSKAGSSGYRRLWTSFSRSGEDCTCQIAGEHSHFIKSFREIFLSNSQVDYEAYLLILSMLNPANEARIDIEGVLALIRVLLCQTHKRKADDVVMTD